MKKQNNTNTDHNHYRLKKALFFIMVLLTTVTFSAQTQTWQWAKSGGSANDLGNYPEKVNSTCTDIYGNVYITSNSGPSSMVIDGVPKTTYSSFGSTDGVIASFSCSGAYRWSKIIGGVSMDWIQRIAADSLGNIYAVGGVSPVTPTQTQIHFDTDTILPSAYLEQNLYNKRLFIVKYNSNGVLQWLRQPQSTNVTINQNNGMYPVDLQVDPLGNSFLLCRLTPDTYGAGAGAFPVTVAGHYILKYDPNGVFLGGFSIDLQKSSQGSDFFKLNRNHTTGNFYIGGWVPLGTCSSNGSILTIGGTVMTKSLFVAAFNSQGTFLWKKENANTSCYLGYDDAYDVAIDATNNIYFTSATGPLSNDNTQPDSFNGVPFVGSGMATTPWPFIVKLDANGNTLWQTNGTKSYSSGIIINGTEVATCNEAYNTQWQNLSYQAPNPGKHPYIARFNKATGTILGIHALSSTGGNDRGTAITSDTNGNYYMGGMFGATLIAGSSTVYMQGSQSDFFIAKFGTTNCDFLGTNQPVLEELKAYPNPVRSSLYLNNKEKLVYVLYGVLGNKIQTGSVVSMGVISLENRASGMYLLQLQNEVGEVQLLKVIKD